MNNIKKGDIVMIIAGKDKGKSGEVISVNPDAHRVIVDDANMISKSVRPRSAQEKGGIVKQAGTIDVSNVMLVCPKCEKVVRVKHEVVEKDGKQVKVRICAKCGASLDEKAAKKSAKKVAKKTKKATKKASAEVTAE
ncbi:MAG: 50S ribosomal protein L24 [Eubacteriales bacterium]|nr:50S ribosomal protein L24 [Eubacteriales bacterium]MDY5439183.1 50S ribosomal protein L24 [Eubacteriales bacterium]